MESYYYSIQTFQNPTEHIFLIDDFEMIEHLYRLFNKMEVEKFSANSHSAYELSITCTVESDLLNSPDYRDYSNLDIERIVSSIEPLEYYDTGYRFEIVSERFMSVLINNNIEEMLYLPVRLHNKFSNRSWINYFALRFTAYSKRSKAMTRKLFVDDKFFTTYYSEEIKDKLEALGIQNQQFQKIIPSKFT
jgi:hypothetical protein